MSDEMRLFNESARSPHDLTTPEGCRAEAARVHDLVIESGQSAEYAIDVEMDWRTEALEQERRTSNVLSLALIVFLAADFVLIVAAAVAWAVAR